MAIYKVSMSMFIEAGDESELINSDGDLTAQGWEDFKYGTPDVNHVLTTEEFETVVDIGAAGHPNLPETSGMDVYLALKHPELTHEQRTELMTFIGQEVVSVLTDRHFK